MENYNGQLEQDKFVLTVLRGKRDGNFLEIGSNHPININNTYILEKNYGWRGIMVEYSKSWLATYVLHRPNSVHVIHDSRFVDYKKILDMNGFPLDMDYLQIDLEAENGSTIETLEKLNNDVFDTYKFRVVTFEHDVYHTNFKHTRERSREIFMNRGYVRVFDDVCCPLTGRPFEDWYVCPSLVDMELINNLKTNNAMSYKPPWGDWVKGELYKYGIIPIINKTISSDDIVY